VELVAPARVLAILFLDRLAELGRDARDACPCGGRFALSARIGSSSPRTAYYIRSIVLAEVRYVPVVRWRQGVLAKPAMRAPTSPGGGGDAR
jgi:hypothetical protein